MRKRKHDASAANAGEAIPGLLNDIVVTHVLRSENFDDPARMFKRRAAPATGRSPVVSRTPLSGSGKRRAPRGAAVVACERLACGTQTRARLRRWAGISRCCSGHARTAARGTWTRARTRRRAGISRRCSGPARTAARGTRTRWRWRVSMSKMTCLSGQQRTVRLTVLMKPTNQMISDE